MAWESCGDWRIVGWPVSLVEDAEGMRGTNGWQLSGWQNSAAKIFIDEPKACSNPYFCRHFLYKP